MSGICRVHEAGEADWNGVLASMEDVLGLLRAQLTQLWGRRYATAKLPFLPPRFICLRPEGIGSYNVQCGAKPTVFPNTPDAYFCGTDPGTLEDGSQFEGEIVFPLDSLTQVLDGCVWNTQIDAAEQTDPYREQLMYFAIGLVAHEFGHAIQYYRRTANAVPLPSPPNDELLSDCIAGDFVWRIEQAISPIATERNTRSSNKSLRARMDQATKDRIRQEGFEAIGDLKGTVSHGTPQQRLDAFLLGYTSAESSADDPAGACFPVYG